MRAAGACCDWDGLTMEQAVESLLELVDARGAAELAGAEAGMREARDMGRLYNQICMGGLRDLLTLTKPDVLRRYCTALGNAVRTRTIGKAHVLPLVSHDYIKGGKGMLYGRKRYMLLHTVAALCYMCELPIEGDVHQAMGVGYGDEQVERLAGVCATVGRLNDLAGLNAKVWRPWKLTWRTIAYFYCAQLKEHAAELAFVHLLERLSKA